MTGPAPEALNLVAPALLRSGRGMMFDAGSPSTRSESKRGYLPTRDQMLAIQRAASVALETLDGWHSCSTMPGFPVDSGAKVALRLIFDMERALNPTRSHWAEPARKRPEVRVWPDKVEVGLHWIREVFDLLMARAELESMATAASLEAWRAVHSGLPTAMSFRVDELAALREALAWLSTHDASSGEGSQTSTPVDAAGRATIDRNPVGRSEAIDGGGNPWETSEPPVILMAANLHPFVLGVRVEKLTGTQYRVVKALLDAWPESLSLIELQKASNSGDAPRS